MPGNRKQTDKAKNWFKDPNVVGLHGRKSPRGGGPADNHPRRCQSRNRFGLQCGRWALRGIDYCKVHCGSKARTKRYDPLPVYSRYVGPKLKKKLDELKEVAHERASLAEEVDLSRVLTSRAVAIWDAVVENDPDGLTPAELASARAKAFVAMRECLKLNSDLVAKMVDLDEKTKNAIPATNIAWFVHHIQRILEKHIGDHKALKAILKDIEALPIASDAPGTRVVLSIEE